MQDVQEVSDALLHVSADVPRTEWVEILMAVNDWDPGPSGMELARTWSKTAPARYEKGKDVGFDAEWASIAPGGGVTIKTLFGKAHKAGWRWERDASEIPIAPTDPLTRLSGIRGWPVESFAALGAKSVGEEVHFPMRDWTGEIVGYRRRRGDNGLIKVGKKEAKSVGRYGDKNGILMPWPLSGLDPVFVVEGEADALAVLSAGALAVVGTPGCTPGHDCLVWIQHALGGRRCILFPDPDVAGSAWLEQEGKALTLAKCQVSYVPAFPERDLDKRLAREVNKAEALDKLVASAVPFKMASEDSEERAPGGGMGFTDADNVRRLARRYGRDFRYDWGSGLWRLWRNGCWREDRVGEIHRAAEVTARAIRNETEGAGEGLVDKIRAWSAQSLASARLNAMIDMATRREPFATDGDYFDASPDILNTQGGIYDTMKRTMNRQVNDRPLVTRQTTVGYNPDAKRETWLNFLEWAVPDGAAREYLQRLCGYALVGEKNERVFVILKGPTASGKTLFVETLAKAFGTYAKHCSPELFIESKNEGGDRPQPTLLGLRGVRLLVMSEAKDGNKLDAGMVKRLVGNDTISCRTLHAKPVEFRPSFLPILATNYTPRMDSDDDALMARLRVIDFPNSLSDESQNPELCKDLEAELEGILAWAIEGCARWREKGLLAPESVKVATKQLGRESDEFAGFAEERLVFGEVGESVRNKEVRAAYADWCKEMGMKPCSDKRLSQKMKTYGAIGLLDKNGRYWQRVRILSTVNQPIPGTEGQWFNK